MKRCVKHINETLFPEISIAFSFYLMNLSLWGYLHNLAVYRRMLDVQAEKALYKPYKDLSDSIEVYLLRMIDTWQAFAEVCSAYEEAVRLVVDLDTLKTHLECVQQRYEAVNSRLDDFATAGERAYDSFRMLDDSIAQYLAEAPILRRIVRLLDSNWYEPDFRLNNFRDSMEHISLRIVDRDAEAVVRVKSAVSDAVKRLPEVVAGMQTLSPKERVSMGLEAELTRYAVLRLRELEMRAVDMFKDFEKGALF
ncbi:hypothetical protein BD626DRAFT_517574 [Schizophyllum amplum]|uniref:Uncharacterized protein n=1 Tax=Schizophyllum amplum TaxID=97359 RepID=A0A550BWC0_9AGAR|nr:hypothetical protein BD626DRAFT_517574 [Auriculariopsis ampla]